MAWLLPELELGLEPELKPLELLEPLLELLEEPVLEEPVLVEPELEEPELVDPVLLEPVLDEPVPEEPEVDEPVLEDPVLVEVPLVDEPVELAVVWVDPGKARVTAPAATTLAMVTAVVAERTLARPRARAAMACWTPSRGALLMSPILRSGHRHFLRETSRLAMKAHPASAGLRLPSEHEAKLKPLNRPCPLDNGWARLTDHGGHEILALSMGAAPRRPGLGIDTAPLPGGGADPTRGRGTAPPDSRMQP